MRALGLMLSLSLLGCTGEVDGPVDPPPDPCVGLPSPTAPSITAPADGILDVTAEGLAIDSSPFAGGADMVHVGSEFELWTLAADGSPRELAWSASVSDPARLLHVTLADGQFAAGVSGLEPFGRYGVRVRHVADLAGCSRYSDYSPRVAFRADDGSVALFDDSQLREVELELPQTTIDALNAQAIPPGCVPFNRDYYPGTLIIDGERYEDVGVKTKGGCGSARTLDQKAGFKVDLEWDDPAVDGCPLKRKHRGQAVFTFNNQVQDGSQIHERLAYAVYRAMGVPVPRAASVRLKVNGEVWGVYLDLETHGRRMLARHFANNDGMMYEGTYWCDLFASNLADDDSGCLTREFHPDVCDTPDAGGDPLDYSTLSALIDEVETLSAMPSDAFYPAITAAVDWDRFLAMWAVDAVIGHWDGHEFGIINNYRMYHDPASGLFTFMPSGTDQTFDLDLDPWNVGARLPQRCLMVPACEAAFAAKLREAAAAFESLDLATRAQAAHDQIRATVELERGRNVDVGTLDDGLARTLGFIAGRPARIREILTAHGF